MFLYLQDKGTVARCHFAIVDYTFSDVNSETVPLAPREAMQFGRALQRIIQTIVQANPRCGPVHMSKIDIADAFYRVWVQTADVPKLGVALPVAPGNPPLVAFPLGLPMGWVESPPYFTALTETICDLANAKLADKKNAPPAHRLEQVASTPPAETPHPPVPCTITPSPSLGLASPRPPVGEVDIYVDDFLLLAQTKHQQNRVLRATPHSIDDVFWPVEPQDPKHRKEPVSVKKNVKR